MIDGPMDAEDGSLYNAPFREAKLGSIHSKDIFDEGLKIAKRQESLFKAHVAEEKEKDLAHQLNQLRESLPKHHRITAKSVWNHIESTANMLFNGLSDIRSFKKKTGPTKTVIDVHVDVASPAATAATSSQPSISAHDRHLAETHALWETSGSKRRSRIVHRQEQRQRAQHERAASELLEEEKEAEGERRRRRAASKARTERLADFTAVSHRVHRTRPGETGGVVCAPPFCDGGDLPAVLPGDSAAVAARHVWRHMAQR